MSNNNKLPPGPKGLPFVGVTLDYLRNPATFMLRNVPKYGDIMYYKVGPYKVFVLSHPDYIKDVLTTNHRNFIKGAGTEYLKPIVGEGLLTSEGDFHLRQRRLAQPAFHRRRIASYGETMVAYAALLGDRWQEGRTVDMAEEMMGLTLAIVGKTLFSSDVESVTEEVAEALDAFMGWWLMFLLPFPSFLHRLPLPINRRFKIGKEKLDATIYRLIREHRESGEDDGDLLSMLLMAQDTEGDGGNMTDQQLRDEAVTIFLAGHETTANALTWTWYLLSQHPDVERRFHEELDEVLGGRLPTVEDLPKLSYTEMVLAESMRLYPPAWGIGRRVMSDYEVGGYTVPEGSVVVMAQYVMHRHPRYYTNPGKFDPMRWTPEERDKRPKFAYFPFGGGNRVCIGEQFAWMEGVLLMATLGRKWRMRLAPGHRVQTQPLVTLRTKGGMPMILMRNA